LTALQLFVAPRKKERRNKTPPRLSLFSLDGTNKTRNNTELLRAVLSLSSSTFLSIVSSQTSLFSLLLLLLSSLSSPSL